ncbi:MAG TPA: MBOAT family O-acyltransferase [Gemmatimonadales bacterium]|jgi:D-alanyl-lipoteichoic acid acyltransferase DltB (MBOAT superfamily)
MVFNSLTFLVFFAIVLIVYHGPLSWTQRKFFLLVASYLFYAAWNPPFVLLLMGSTVIDWLVAKRLAVTERPAARKALLLISLGFNLGVLGFFKYGGFLLDNFTRLMAQIGVQYQPPHWNIILPIGISFYTFLTLSYTIDVYRRELQPGKSFLDFAFFVTFFPHLVAGPILRAADFLPQCVEPRKATQDQLGWGLALMVIGLFEKVVLADALMAPTADHVYAAVSRAGFLDAWAGTLAFSGQIFLDFAGYSTCAIGAALCLGFVLPDNFRFPYAAIGFSDFWRRWHISLSTWLRDYLYIPLGGNRGGESKARRNLMLTMLLGGLWHGASWRFVAWGGLHGSYLVLERMARRLWGGAAWLSLRAVRVGLGLLTFATVCLTWVFFRAHSFGDARVLLTTMLSGAGSDQLVLGAGNVLGVAAVTLFLLGAHWWMRDTSLEARWEVIPWWGRSLVLATLLLALVLVPGEDRAFIYFQF